MVKYINVNGKKGKLMVMEQDSIKMGINILEIMLIMLEMDMEYIYSLMVIAMKEIGLKEKLMEKEFLNIIMEMNMKENLKII